MAAPAAATDAEVEDGAGAKKGIPKLFIIIGAAVIVVLLGGGGLFFFMSSGKTEEASADHAAAAGEHAPAGEHGGTVDAAHTFIFNLPPMVINLNNEVDGPAFMKLTVALEVANEEMMLEIQPRLVKVIDAFQVYLRELRKSDLEGSAGIYRLKEELLRRVNVAIYPSRVESLLFKELLVQ
ncbi:flagellar basal body-associated FliL family protein [Devosia aquimaris]|uniref:flagellar basal body-associated FliL family protein n=1 Tax=Devosia aquimaris TaxID=2866214 RepID=UPI001CD18D29|nr:flagellar basal body-associated FliL family protein [Devosia sp. CJK-A8-3]